jgi:SRSO17 transposase
MGQHLDGNDGQHLHHLLTQSPWSHSHLFKLIEEESRAFLRQYGRGCYLLIDEVGFRKKGSASACVGRQYLGCIGTHDNGQVAVASAVSIDQFYCPIDIKLFMPQSWEGDFQRRSRCGIPDSERHLSKTEMALHMILKTYPKLPNLKYVVFDSLYGANVDLLNTLIQHRIPFIGGTKKSYRVYLKQPKWILPEKKKISGPKFSIKAADQKPLQIQSYLKTLKRKDFKEVRVRNSTKGTITSRFHLCKVWVEHKPSKMFLPLQLLVRKDFDGQMYYSLCYSPKSATLKELAKGQAQRVFVERIFEEGKNIVGMGDYQTRSWEGFHRHMALCSLSLLFLMKQKLRLLKTAGTLTAYQIQELINLATKFLSDTNQIIQNIAKRVSRYQTAIKFQGKMVT